MHYLQNWCLQLNVSLIAKWWPYLERASFKLQISVSHLFLDAHWKPCSPSLLQLLMWKIHGCLLYSGVSSRYCPFDTKLQQLEYWKLHVDSCTKLCKWFGLANLPKYGLFIEYRSASAFFHIFLNIRKWFYWCQVTM